MSDPGTVSVVGQGRAEGAPDVCRVTLAATVLRPTVTAALADGEQAVRRVRDALAAAGVTGRDAATTAVSVRAEEDYSGSRGPRLVGYRAEHVLAVVLRDLAAAGRVLGDAVTAGGDDVRLQAVTFAVEDDAPLRAAAREAAWHDARRAAEHLAGLAGTALGPVRSVRTAGGGDDGGPRPLAVAARLAPAPEVGLEPGEAFVGVDLAVVWELR